MGVLVWVAVAFAPSALAVPTQGELKQVFDTDLIEGGPYYLNDHSFVQAKDGSWHLFGIFNQEPFGIDNEFNFVHAVTSEANPKNWKKDSFRIAPAPHSMALTVDKSIGETHLWAPHVVRHGDLYFMVYHSGATDNHKAHMRLAISSDLYNWVRVGKLPLFEDICMSRDPMLFQYGDEWIMYYTRCESRDNEKSGVAYRTSRDLFTWSKPKMALILRDTPSMFNSGYTESPFVFERNGWFYLTITSYPIDWTATMVYRSKTPYVFWPTAYARLEAHAAEWIFDQDGQAWMTHCGAGQRGAWLTPVSGL